jgi:hypothetical protein
MCAVTVPVSPLLSKMENHEDPLADPVAVIITLQQYQKKLSTEVELLRQDVATSKAFQSKYGVREEFMRPASAPTRAARCPQLSHQPQSRGCGGVARASGVGRPDVREREILIVAALSSCRRAHGRKATST